jgi:hypothetical protein
LFFPRKLPKARGLFANGSCLLRGAAAWRLPGDRRCHVLLAAWRPRRLPGDAPGRRSSLSFLSLALLLSLPSSFSSPLLSSLSPVKTYSNRSSPPSAAVLRSPLLLREAEKVCLAAHNLPVEGIDPRWSESPPNHRIPRRKWSSSAAKFVVAGHPPAKATSPTGSR